MQALNAEQKYLLSRLLDGIESAALITIEENERTVYRAILKRNGYNGFSQLFWELPISDNFGFISHFVEVAKALTLLEGTTEEEKLLLGKVLRAMNVASEEYFSQYLPQGETLRSLLLPMVKNIMPTLPKDFKAGMFSAEELINIGFYGTSDERKPIGTLSFAQILKLQYHLQQERLMDGEADLGDCLSNLWGGTQITWLGKQTQLITLIVEVLGNTEWQGIAFHYLASERFVGVDGKGYKPKNLKQAFNNMNHKKDRKIMSIIQNVKSMSV